MKTNHILTSLAFAFALAGAGTAQATPLPLFDASITATYNGAAEGMLGLDHGFAQEAGSNTSTLDPGEGGVEFLTADFLFGIDFSAGGALTVIANGTAPTGPYRMTFDFGDSLALPISAFALSGVSGTSGLPLLAILDAHTIALDLAAVGWDEFGSFPAQIDTAEVPEPAAPAIVLAALAGLALTRRLRTGGGK